MSANDWDDKNCRVGENLSVLVRAFEVGSIDVLLQNAGVMNWAAGGGDAQS